MRQRSKAEGIRLRRKSLPLWRPFHVIPGNRLRNVELRLPLLVELNIHCSRRMLRIALNESGFQPKPLQLLLRFLSERVVS